MPRDYALPELGEEIDSADVLKVLVAEGDTIQSGQNILELETDKATVEVPCPFGGRVMGLHVKEGDQVRVGARLISIEPDTASATAQPALASRSEEARPAAPAQPAPEPLAPPATEPTANAPPAAARVPTTPPRPRSASAAAEPPAQMTAPEPGPDADAVLAGEEVAAAPSTRRLAREVGVDLRKVTGTGPGGRITAQDVKAYVQAALQAVAHPVARQTELRATLTTASGEEMILHQERVERQPFKSIRKKTAIRVTHAWQSIPHVTQFDEADVTELEDLRKRYANEAERRGGKLTSTALVIKAAAHALKDFPQFNASLDLDADEIVLKHFYHIGVAVDTDRGLIVPVLRDVDTKDIFALAKELLELAARAREGSISLDALQNGTFTITNLGGIGGTGFTPIVKPPEVAILGVSRIRLQPVVRGGKVVSRLMMPLSVSYDHRVIDGADGARFLRRVAARLEDPQRLLLGV